MARKEKAKSEKGSTATIDGRKATVERVRPRWETDYQGVKFSALDKSKAGQRIDPSRPAVYGNRKGGHGYKITEEVINKLERSFMGGHTIIEACALAGISTEIYYRWLRQNPDFKAHADALRKIPSAKARANVTASINDGNLDVSRWYLERVEREEFGNKTDITVSTPSTLSLQDAHTATQDLISRYLQAMSDRLPEARQALEDMGAQETTQET